MKHLVFLLEEPSAKEMLNGLLPRLLPGVRSRCIVFEGKQDLEKNLIKKIRAYRVPNSRGKPACLPLFFTESIILAHKHLHNGRYHLRLNNYPIALQ